jgi:hypothetical protein
MLNSRTGCEVHFTDNSKPDEVTKLVAGGIDQGSHNTFTIPNKAPKVMPPILTRYVSFFLWFFFFTDDYLQIDMCMATSSTVAPSHKEDNGRYVFFPVSFLYIIYYILNG